MLGQHITSISPSNDSAGLAQGEAAWQNVSIFKVLFLNCTYTVNVTSYKCSDFLIDFYLLVPYSFSCGLDEVVELILVPAFSQIICYISSSTRE